VTYIIPVPTAHAGHFTGQMLIVVATAAAQASYKAYQQDRPHADATGVSML